MYARKRPLPLCVSYVVYTSHSDEHIQYTNVRTRVTIVCVISIWFRFLTFLQKACCGLWFDNEYINQNTCVSSARFLLRWNKTHCQQWWWFNSCLRLWKSKFLQFISNNSLSKVVYSLNKYLLFVAVIGLAVSLMFRFVDCSFFSFLVRFIVTPAV